MLDVSTTVVINVPAGTPTSPPPLREFLTPTVVELPPRPVAVVDLRTW
jgi:hypothetical protein